jgi:hypothetical protein
MNQSANPLSVYARDITSQDGEDGIIERIFELIGAENKWCLELGALNGTHDSNTRHLVHDLGWNALLIEADVTYYTRLAKLYEGNPKAHCVNAFVSFEGAQSLDALCKAAGMPRDFDFLSLDIDGNDYHLWDSMREFAPRVVCIEFNQTIPNDVEFVQPRDMRVFQGSSLASLAKLAKRKGYELVATTATNAFFVRRELYPKLGIADNSLAALHSDTRYQTKLYQLYDGTLKIAGYDRLFWHRVPIDLEALQVLPRNKRVYPARIPESSAVRSFKAWARRSPLYALVQKLRKQL